MPVGNTPEFLRWGRVVTLPVILFLGNIIGFLDRDGLLGRKLFTILVSMS